MSLGVIDHFLRDEAFRMLKKLVTAGKKFVIVNVPTKLHIQTVADREYAPINVVYDQVSLSELMRIASLKVIDAYERDRSLAVLGVVPETPVSISTIAQQ
jgi:hypothetical protein